jgi:hypothetical protein
MILIIALPPGPGKIVANLGRLCASSAIYLYD